MLADSGGAAHRTDLLRAGVPERAIRRAVDQERVKQIGHGTYALPWTPRDVALATLFRAHIGCVTACKNWGLPTWEDSDRTHLIVPRHRSGSRRGPLESSQVTVHYTSAPLSSGRWVPVAQAVDQAGWCTSPVGQLVIVDAALHAGVLLTRDIAHFEQRDGRRRAWLRRMASRAAESPPETVARVAMTTAGLAVREQVAFPGIGRVDFVVEDAVVVEIDGWAFHGDRDAFEADRARDRQLLGDGMPVMRFTAKQVRADPMEMARAVARVVGRAPHARLAERMRWTLGTPRRLAAARSVAQRVA